MTFVDGLDTFDIAPVVVPVKSITLNGTRTKSSIIGAVLVSRDGIVGKMLLLTIVFNSTKPQPTDYPYCFSSVG